MTGIVIPIAWRTYRARLVVCLNEGTTVMQLLNGRQRVAAASLLKKRDALWASTPMMPDDPAYKLWYDLVCSEIQRLGVIDPGQIKEFCDRAGVPADAALPLGAASANAA